MLLVDSHCHLDVAEFDPDRAAVLERARAAGVIAQIVPAISAASWPRLRDLCATTTGLYPAYGLHPLYLAEHRPQHLRMLGEWLERERPVAVGEIGLDGYVEGLDPARQLDYLEAQLDLARRFDLPVIVHARRALEPLLLALRRHRGLRGVVHSFSGSEEQLRQLLRLDFAIGLGGPVTYPRAQRLHRIATQVPLDRLLLESDAPDQPLYGHAGRRNEPMQVREVCLRIAALRRLEPERLAESTSANARALFGLPDGTADRAADPGPSPRI